jgi:hypothetical protein
MKGIEKIVSLLIAIIIVVILVGIYIYFGGYYIVGWALPAAKEQYYISSLCPEWVQNRCTEASASPPDGISIMVDNVPTYLSELCDKAHPGGNWLAGCREDCKGCT